jgi:ABC-type branched-subunit amino acid transport system ATPase component
MAALLQLDKTTIRFGGLTAVSDLDLQIGANELVGLIGPNGAGKTTVFNLITGVYQPQQTLPHHRARHCAHVPEHPAVSVADRFRQRAHRVSSSLAR